MRQDWKSSEISTLSKNAHQGIHRLMELFPDRSRRSIEGACYRNNISIRRTGERRGRLLGQPRGLSLLYTYPNIPVIRTYVLAGRIDMSLVLERIALQAAGRVTICPACGQRPQEVRSTGLCRVCHKRELTKALKDEMAVIEAQREQWSAQQQVSRMRRRAEPA